MTRIPKAKSAAIATLGIDIGKNTFHLIGLDKRGAIVLRERLSPGPGRGTYGPLPLTSAGTSSSPSSSGPISGITH